MNAKTMERISNEEKANKLAKCDCQKHYKGFSICNTDKYHGKNYCARKAIALQAMEWKDEQFAKEKQELRHQIQLLIDAIDHAYLRLDGTYGNLSYEVSDQVKYVKSMQTIKLMKGE